MDASAAIEHACRHSRYLTRLLAAHPETAEALATTLQAHASAAVLEEWLSETPFDQCDESALKSALRRLRARTMAHLIVRDLAGLADLDEVTEGMTLLAELRLARLNQHDQTFTLLAAAARFHAEQAPSAIDGEAAPEAERLW